jgi:putative transposase
MHRIHQEGETTQEQELTLDLDQIARQGAQKMLAQALQAEVRAYLEAAQGERDEHTGHALVVRNGYHIERQVVCGAGNIEVRAPRVNDRRVEEQTGERKRSRSVILPPYMRRSAKVSEMLPLLYLHGLSTGDFAPALEEFFGTGAGLSPKSISRLTEQRQQEREAFEKRELSGKDYVYVWVDGIHTKVRLGQDDRLCVAWL